MSTAPASTLDLVRAAAATGIFLTPHAILQMTKPKRMISRADVEIVVACGMLIEDYPEDVRGHSCLLLGTAAGARRIHVVCSPKEEYLTIITAYIPNPAHWSPDFTRRTRK